MGADECPRDPVTNGTRLAGEAAACNQDAGRVAPLRLRHAEWKAQRRQARGAPEVLAGLLTRDPRAKERKKYGLKRARKAPQYTKR